MELKRLVTGGDSMLRRRYIPTLTSVLHVSAEFVLRKHSGGFERERGTLLIETRHGDVLSYRGLPGHVREKIREWVHHEIETFNFYEDVYREKERA